MSSPKPAGPVWSKRVGPGALSDANLNWCSGYDVRSRAAADRRLTFYDLQTNAAHLLMLVTRGIVAPEQGGRVAQALFDLRKRAESGEDLLRTECEDIHISLETAITEMIGEEAGGRLHTARSRNDQVSTDMRLWMRSDLAARAETIYALAGSIAEHARTHAETVCPGFTHMQPAMVTTWGHWTMSWLPRILRHLRRLATSLNELALCPLGAAASYGTGWPIDRRHTAKLLGFREPTTSGADGIQARGELEADYAQALAQVLAHLSSIGQDLILLSTPPRQWLRLAERHTTGSSIMPQKRNPDFAEVTRARAANAAGIAQSLLGLTIGAPSGYNRDSQWAKYLVFDAADNADGGPELFAEVISELRVDADAMHAACGVGFLTATDIADHISRSRGLPFRSTYKILGAAVNAAEAEGKLTLAAMNGALSGAGIDELTEAEWAGLEDAKALVAKRDQIGNPAPGRTIDAIDRLGDELFGEVDEIRRRRTQWEESIERLWDELRELAGS